MPIPSLVRRTRRGAVATVVAGTALALVGQELLGAAPARASLTGPGVDDGEHVTVSSDADSVAVHGHPEGTPLVVEVLRQDPATSEDVVLGRASGPARALEGGPGLAVNAGPAGVAAQPGDCWDVQTPDIRPGDRVVVTTPEDTDEVTVDDLRWTGPPALDRDTGDVLVAGVARYADGEPIPVAELTVDEFADDTGGYRIVADEVVATDADGGFRIRYRTPFTGSRNDAELTRDQRAAVLLGNGHGVEHVVYAEPPAAEVVPGETVLGETVLEEPRAGGTDASSTEEPPAGEDPAGEDPAGGAPAGTTSDEPRPVETMRITGPAETPGPAEGCEDSPAAGDTPLPADEATPTAPATEPADDSTDTDTETETDGAAPTVTAATPADAATGVAVGTPVTVTFSEPVRGVDATTLTLTGPDDTPVPADVTYDPDTTTATLEPRGPLAADTAHTASVEGVTDDAGDPLAATSWTFTTAPAAQEPADTTPPQLTAQTPAAGGTGVALDAPVTAVFSEDVTGAGDGGLTLTGPDGAVPADVRYDPATRTASLTPDAPLAWGTTYTAAVGAGITDAAGLPPAATAWTFSTAPAPDTTAPAATATSPGSGASAVPLDAPVTATFSEPVTGVDSATLTLTGPDGAVPATVTYDPATRVATLDPAAPLPPGTAHVATVTEGIRDAAGHALARSSWTFTTGPAPDTAAPTVAGATPTDGTAGVPRDATVTATFSEPVDGVGPATMVLRPDGGDAVPAAVRYDPATRAAVLDPAADLAPSTRYTAALDGAVRDAAGNRLAPVSWSFSTAAPAPAVAVAAPAISDRTPAPGATGVAREDDVRITFSEPVTGVDADTVTLRAEGLGAVSAAVRYDPRTRVATLAPAARLVADTTYTVGVGSGVRDTAGDRLAATTWRFTTEAAPPPDRTRPTITGHGTPPGATGIAPDATVALVFSEPVTGLTGSSVTLRSAAGRTVPADLRIDPGTNSVALVPTVDLAPGTRYTVTIGTAVRDAAGNRFPGTSWTFTTAAGPGDARSAVRGR